MAFRGSHTASARFTPEWSFGRAVHAAPIFYAASGCCRGRQQRLHHRVGKRGVVAVVPLDRRPRASSSEGSAPSYRSAPSYQLSALVLSSARARGEHLASSTRRLGERNPRRECGFPYHQRGGDMEPHVFPYSQTQQQSARGGVRRPPSPRGRLATEVDGGGDGEADGGAELHQALLELLGVAQRELIGRRLETPAAAARAAAARARVRGGRRLTRRRTTAASRRAYARERGSGYERRAGV